MNRRYHRRAVRGPRFGEIDEFDDAFDAQFFDNARLGIDELGESLDRAIDEATSDILNQTLVSQPTLRIGSRGAAVEELQQRLTLVGFPVGIDGIFGAGTAAAVRSYQRTRDLTSDGIVGPRTWAALQDSSGTPVVVPKTPVVLPTILGAMAGRNYVVFTRPYQLNIVGMRGANAQPNTFDDSINVFFKDRTGNWTSQSSPATTDPGTFWLNNPENVKGTAIVVPGQYVDAYEIGLHPRSPKPGRTQYPALLQKGPIKVIPDFNKDDHPDFSSVNIEEGVFGINIHRASATETGTIVDTFSAGCQVFASPSDFAQFIAWCHEHNRIYGNNFTYTLLDEDDLR